MKFNANQNQKEVLSALLDKYENSKTYKGENQVHQTFSIAPDIIMQEYHSDFADVEKIRLFEAELSELVEEQLVRLELKGTVIRKIFPPVRLNFDTLTLVFFDKGFIAPFSKSYCS